MTIIFLGDSLTVGKPGVSYMRFLDKDSNVKHINLAKAGETTTSLFARIKTFDILDQANHVMLFVGTNDVFSKLSLLPKSNHPKQYQNAFLDRYQKTLSYVLKKTDKVTVISPLIIGENITNKANQILHDYSTALESMISTYNNVAFVDVQSLFYDYLRDKPVSDYLSTSLKDIMADVAYQSLTEINDISKQRHLQLTIDGLHLNETGAKLIATKLNEIL
ncbi:MAG: hypothetical protein K9L26_01155 [Candidatus Izimaplasma sp.]|nr:hypothetical protein [Candidatus Izimaplasma bacterium]